MKEFSLTNLFWSTVVRDVLYFFILELQRSWRMSCRRISFYSSFFCSHIQGLTDSCLVHNLNTCHGKLRPLTPELQQVLWLESFPVFICWQLFPSVLSEAVLPHLQGRAGLARTALLVVSCLLMFYLNLSFCLICSLASFCSQNSEFCCTSMMKKISVSQK